MTKRQDRRICLSEVCEELSPEQDQVARELLRRVSERWTLWALAELEENGPLRFSRLRERLEGVTQKSLTAALRDLERDGLLTRTVTVQVPIRVDYAITPLGRAMIRGVLPLARWAAQASAAVERHRKNYDRRS